MGHAEAVSVTVIVTTVGMEVAEEPDPDPELAAEDPLALPVDAVPVADEALAVVEYVREKPPAPPLVAEVAAPVLAFDVVAVPVEADGEQLSTSKATVPRMEMKCETM